MDAAARRFLEDPHAMNCPWVESPFFDQLLEHAQLTPADAALARKFHEDGYVVLEPAAEESLIDEVLAEYPRLFDPRSEFPEAPVELRELLKRDPSRKQDAWYVSDPVRRLACHPSILRVLKLLYMREPIPFQTLNFVPGTEQSLHSDAMHFSSIPARFMCGVWVALEDATPENGPLRYVPGSHKYSEVQLDHLGLWGEDAGAKLGASYAQYEKYLEALVELHDLPVKQLTVKKGGALVWAANLVHGGSPILDKSRTRKSQVTHYYFENCIYYTPIFSNPALGEIYLRSIYDIHRRRQVPHMLNGTELKAEPLGGGRFRLRR
ncbi:MAG: phytanoyl-CoA dioxygenase family protein [Planctomycetes bacterium]|nr:phytanoyl-CoA dioxygenase family protein [Planctomycetota bacterium]